jgi:hypothetical protein
MTRLEPTPVPTPEGVTQTRCSWCRRFARLLPGETLCNPCAGVLPLDFGKRGER